MVIRDKQFEEVGRDFRHRQSEAYARQVRRQYPAESARYDDRQLRQIVQKDENRAKAFGIAETPDVWRFLALRYSPELQSGDKLPNAAAFRVLRNRDVPAKRRLDFVEQHIVPSLRQHRWPAK